MKTIYPDDKETADTGILLSVHSVGSQQIAQTNQVLLATGGQDIHQLNEKKTWKTTNLEIVDLDRIQREHVFQIEHNVKTGE